MLGFMKSSYLSGQRTSSPNHLRGFTLIELLVVIAIIGILSAVVLASLSTARNKGNDGAVQSNLNSIETQAEVYYDSNNGYGVTNGSAPTIAQCATASTMFVADTTVKNALTSAKNSAKSGSVYCANTATSYIVEALVNGTSTTATYWCIDSTGNAKYEYTAVQSGLTC